MERIYQIDGEKGRTVAPGPLRAMTARTPCTRPQVWSHNFYTIYTVSAIFPAR